MPRVSNNPKSFLKGLSKNWKEAVKTAKENGPSGPVPEGRYEARILEATLDNGQYGWQMIWRMKIINGEYAGKSITRYDGLQGERSLEFVANNLMVFGIDIEDFDIEDLQEMCEQLTKIKPYVQITVAINEKNNKEYRNIYINKHIDDDEVDDETSKDAESSDDDEDEDSAEEAENGEDEDSDNEEESADEDEDEEESEDVQIGMRVEYQWKGQTCTGEVVDIDEEAEKLVIKDDEENKKRSVSVEKVVKLDEKEVADDDNEEEEEEEEEEETPAPKRGRPAGSTNKPKTPAPTPASSGKRTPPPPTGKTRNAAPADDGKKKTFGKLGKK